jgi:uncharacterized protein (TIGR03435 family)
MASVPGRHKSKPAGEPKTRGLPVQAAFVHFPKFASLRHDVVAGLFEQSLRRLGLDLTQRTWAVEALPIDHVEKTPTEN